MKLWTIDSSTWLLSSSFIDASINLLYLLFLFDLLLYAHFGGIGTASFGSDGSVEFIRFYEFSHLLISAGWPVLPLDACPLLLVFFLFFSLLSFVLNAIWVEVRGGLCTTVCGSDPLSLFLFVILALLCTSFIFSMSFWWLLYTVQSCIDTACDCRPSGLTVFWFQNHPSHPRLRQPPHPSHYDDCWKYWLFCWQLNAYSSS